MESQILIMFAIFMSVVFGLYFAFPKKYRYLVLLISSIIMYAIYSKFMATFLLLTIITIYFAGLGMNKLDDKFDIAKQGKEKDERKQLKLKFKKKKKWLAFACVITNLLFLIVLKYFNFFGSIFDGVLSWFNVSSSFPILHIVLPLGISYYTLSAIGYVVDVYRGKYKGETNFCKVALFLSYFPQLLEGPFATFDKLAPQLYEGHSFNRNCFLSGILLVLWGLFKKFIVADRLAIVVSDVFQNYTSYGSLAIIVGILAFTFQLYAEFSGIIDVVTGISKMYNIDLAKNFDQPFFSQSVNEFWRRWHISLGAWFREYVFYPISMSKCFFKMNKHLHGKVNPFFEVFIPSLVSLFCVWALTGLWHGAELKYLVYGLYYYAIMMIGMCFEPLFNLFYTKCKIDKNNKVSISLRIIRTFILVNIGMLIFRATTLSDATSIFINIFNFQNDWWIHSGVIDIYDTIMCIIGLITMFVVDILKEKKIDIINNIITKNGLIVGLVIILMIFFLILFGAYGDGYIPVDPIYGGF